MNWKQIWKMKIQASVTTICVRTKTPSTRCDKHEKILGPPAEGVALKIMSANDVVPLRDHADTKY